MPTMIIGADVSHAAPGMPGAASFAALTMSLDAIAARYAAAVETNGSRVEMIAPRNIEDMLGPLIRNWCENVGQGKLPEHVYYFRDGVSEGQYNALLKHEVADLKRLFYDIGKYNPNLSVRLPCSLLRYVANKRYRSSSLWLWLRSAITSGFSHNLVLDQTKMEIPFLALWSSGMSLIHLNMISIFARMLLSRGLHVQLTITCSWMNVELLVTNFRQCFTSTRISTCVQLHQFLYVSELCHSWRASPLTVCSSGRVLRSSSI